MRAWSHRLGALGLLGLGSCATPVEGPPLSRLVDAWGAQASEQASPFITGSLLLARLGAELCIARSTSEWAESEPGELAPLTPGLLEGLGDPTVERVEVSATGLLGARLEGAQVAGFTGAMLDLTTSVDLEGAFVASVNVLVADEEEADDLVVVGRASWTVQQSCGVGATRLTGSARWTDSLERAHVVQLPADLELSTGVRFDRIVPWIPSSGTLAWQSRADGRDLSVLTEDAGTIEVDGEDTGSREGLSASWRATASGEDWSTGVAVELMP